jgi:hypothetical protein
MRGINVISQPTMYPIQSLKHGRLGGPSLVSRSAQAPRNTVVSLSIEVRLLFIQIESSRSKVKLLVVPRGYRKLDSTCLRDKIIQLLYAIFYTTLGLFIFRTLNLGSVFSYPLSRVVKLLYGCA